MSDQPASEKKSPKPTSKGSLRKGPSKRGSSHSKGSKGSRKGKGGSKHKKGDSIRRKGQGSPRKGSPQKKRGSKRKSGNPDGSTTPGSTLTSTTSSSGGARTPASSLGGSSMGTESSTPSNNNGNTTTSSSSSPPNDFTAAYTSGRSTASVKPPVPTTPSEIRSKVATPDLADAYTSARSVGTVVLKPSLCSAVFDFEASEPGELSFSAGDKITLLERAPDGWWLGELNGSKGVFPAMYVEDLDPPTRPPSMDEEESEASRSITTGSPVTKEGYLKKQGGFWKSWKTRWFVLKGLTLYYFESPRDTKPKGSIVVGGAQLEDSASVFKDPNCWSIQPMDKTRVYVIQAPSPQVRDEWLDALKGVLNSSIAGRG